MTFLTESEARNKWCPFYRQQDTDNRPLGHVKGKGGEWEPTGKLHESCRCIASDCMAWRFHGGTHYGKNPPKDGDWEKVEQLERNYWRWGRRNTGYCGLASKPEDTS